MADARAGSGKIQNKPRILVVPESKKVLKNDEGMSKVYRSQTERAPNDES